MIEINLLPWRHARRVRACTQFCFYLGLGLVTAMGILFLMEYYATQRVRDQSLHNQQLADEVARFKQQQASRLQASREHSKQALEAFPIKSLKFVGVLRHGSMVWAIISQPDGIIASAKIGGYIGTRSGQVIGITDDEIKIEEMTPLAGRLDKKIITMQFIRTSMKDDA